jgi:hypothetical protein
MQFFFSILVPLIGLFLATVVLALLVHRNTGRIWVAALAGGSIIPGIALLDGVIWLNDMEVDDPPPGLILSGYSVGIPIGFVICTLACLLILHVIARRN